MLTILTAPRVITGEREIHDGWIAIEGDLIRDIGEGSIPEGDVVHHDGWLLPGFVDIHVHGGGGGSFATGDIGKVLDFHRKHGTTTMVASLVTDSIHELEAQLHRLVPSVESDEIAGVHLEGPFLSVEKRGAHDEAHLRAPDATSIRRLLDAAHGSMRVVTIAPELNGAPEATAALVDAGVTVAIGHSAADATATRAVVDAGATLVTHLCNGMHPLHHRKAGLIDVALSDQRLSCELILDGIHVSDEMLRLCIRLCADRWIAVTDAVIAAGAPAGEYRLGALTVEAANGEVRVRDSGALAGSTLTMDRAFAHAIHTLGCTPLEAVRATSTRPAGVLSRAELGNLEPGALADVVLWSDDAVHRVMRRGRWLNL